jgi:hypothetical protein
MKRVVDVPAGLYETGSRNRVLQYPRGSGLSSSVAFCRMVMIVFPFKQVAG